MLIDGRWQSRRGGSSASGSPLRRFKHTSSTGGVATLTWAAGTDADLAGYGDKVYMGNASGVYGAPIVAGNVTSYVARNLINR